MLYCLFLNAAKWDESKHKRAKDGKFAKSAGEGSGKSASVGAIGSKHYGHESYAERAA